MDYLKWAFDGIGAALLIFILGLLFTGSATYITKKCKKKTVKQTQKAGKNSKLTQIGGDYNGK